MIWDIIKQIFLKLIIFLEKKTPVSESKEIKKILIVRLDELGDMVLSTPFIREMRRAFPQADISMVVKNDLYELFELCPYVNEIYGYERVSKRLAFVKSFFSMKKFISEQSLVD